MTTALSPIEFTLSDSELVEIEKRARDQEAIYGHNTGHFTLRKEKENTVTGVTGEWAVKKVIDAYFAPESRIVTNFTSLGSPTDLEVSKGGAGTFGIHVKTGLWGRWPQSTFEFGIHSDQGIESGSSPLVLVTLLRRSGGYANHGRIEGWITPHVLRESPIIQKGSRFPRSGVVSRTTNIVTTFDQYRHLEELRAQIAASLDL